VSWKPKTRARIKMDSASLDRDLARTGNLSVEQITNSFSHGHQNPAGCSTQAGSESEHTYMENNFADRARM
jgi:hypothetical protein